MNINVLIIAMLVAIIIINLFKGAKQSDRQILYVLYLASFAFYYGVFAVFSASAINLLLEILMSSPFFLLAGFCLLRDGKENLLLIAGAYLLHALYDFYHGVLFENPGIPDWWPDFSGMINLMIGIYIVAYNFMQDRHHMQVRHCGALR